LEGEAIDENLTFMNGHNVAWQTNYALYKSSFKVERKSKNYDFASLWIVPPIGQAINDDEFAVMQAWFHTAAFNSYPCGEQIYS
jgi:hypothetical protein